MSTVAPAVEPTAPARTSGLAATFEHISYVLGENRVTAFAFGLLIVILFAAIFGPYIVPYDPLASDTSAALCAIAPSAIARATGSLTAPCSSMVVAGTPSISRLAAFE